MIHDSPSRQLQNAKSQSRGVSCDMSPDAVLRRLSIVDELRELARELKNAKRLGPLDTDPASLSASKSL